MKKRFSKIYIEITNICNLKCKFCLETNRKKEFMEIDSFEKIANKICKYTDLILLHVKGEPLLHKKLDEILNIAFKYNLKVNITTNTLLLENNFETLINSKALRQINLSIHDLEQNNIDDNFEDVVKISKKIKEKNSKLIISYRLWNMNNLGENDKNRKFLKILEDEYSIENLYEKCVHENFVKLDDNVFLNQDIEFKWPNIGGKILREKGKCYGLKNQIAILVNGDVVPCCLDTNGDIVLGNILRENLEDILNSKRAKDIISGFNENRLVENLCKRCDFIKKIN